jgi:hypothetical protein
MRSLYFVIQLRRSRLDACMPDSHILHVPMETGLPLMSSVCTDGMDPKRKLLDHVINKIDGAFLVVFPIKL